MTEAAIRSWLSERIARALALDAASIDVNSTFDSFGLSSVEAVRLSGDLEQLLGRDLSPTLVYDHPSIGALARHLAGPARVAEARASAGASAAEPIAIVGMACRFPGAAGPDAFWRLLRDGIDAIGEVPRARWDVGALHLREAAAPGRLPARWGGFLEQVDRFDAFFFGISPGEAERMDPQQRLLLELAWEAFEDAGCPMTRLAGSPTGVFAGVSVNEYSWLQHDRLALLNGHSATGNALSIAANRISYFFDLHGPSLAVDTACSSSLMAVHLACRSLRAGECDLALAGGANVILSPAHAIAFGRAGVLAADGRCKSFDAAADGYVRGEGGGLVVLKPLARALAEGDTIHAVIRGSAAGQDGRTNGLMAPNGDAQERVLRDAYRDARLSPSAVQYVEAHGTGTLLGDAMEARALGAVVGRGRTEGPCRIGSVKSNIGHLEAAAGVAGLLKVVLALKHRDLPRSLHFSAANPHVPFAELGIEVQHAASAWPLHTGPATAGVSSFGFGGTNVHVVLEEAPRAVPAAARGEEGVAHLLPLAAHLPEALAASARDLSNWLDARPADEPADLHEVCAAVAMRSALPHRAAIVAASIAELTASLGRLAAGDSDPRVQSGHDAELGGGRLAFVFPGQGSQWPGMHRALLAQGGACRAALEHCDHALAAHTGWSLLARLRAGDEDGIDVVQPVLFSVQVALAAWWRAWGMEPDAVVGHSMGEAAAAYVAGCLSLEDAACVIALRSRLLRRLGGLGGMALVGLDPKETLEALRGYGGRLVIAAMNGPAFTVVSGETPALDALQAELERRDVLCRRIAVDVASHGPQVSSLAAELRCLLAHLAPATGAIPFESTVAVGNGPLALDGAYWARNLAEPVNFDAAIARLLASGHTAFVEIGPHPQLVAGIRQRMIRAGVAGVALPSLARDEPAGAAMLRAVGGLWAAGRPVDWTRVIGPPTVRPPLPTYPWQRRRFWMEGTAFTPRREPAWDPQGSAHPLLGQRTAIAAAPDTWVWHAAFDLERMPWLRDHRVHGEAVLPAALLLQLARAAAAQAGLAPTHALTEVTFLRRVALDESTPAIAQVSLVRDPAGSWTFRVHANERGGRETPGPWMECMRALLVPSPGVGESGFAQARARCEEVVSFETSYDAFAGHGMEYGPAFRTVRSAWRGHGEALGRLAENSSGGRDTCLLDGAFQVLAAAVPSAIVPGSNGVAFVPVSCARVTGSADLDHAAWAHVVLRGEPGAADAVVEADIHVLDEGGAPLVAVEGLRVARLARRSANPEAPVEDTWTYEVRWVELDAPPAAQQPVDATSQRWLILADGSGLAGRLQAALVRQGQRCDILAWQEEFVRDDGTPDGRRTRRTAVRRRIDDALLGDGTPLHGVVHLWSVDGLGAGTPGWLDRAQALGCDAVLSLVHGLVAHADILGAPRLWIATSGAQPVVAGDGVSVAQSGLWGLGRTIALELPELHCRLVDVDPSRDPGAGATMLERELRLLDDEDQVAWRGARRFVSRLWSYVPRTRACPGPLAFEAHAAYVITGGLGGLGLAVAEWMAERGARHLVLVGRHAPSGAALTAIARMEALGVDVTPFTADVAVESEVRRLLAEIDDHGPSLRGIVHAAGVLDNAPLATMAHEQLDTVLAPKVAGGWHLHAATRDRPLDFFVSFASAVSVLGSPGQGNYAAANSFLDALAHHRAAAKMPALSIDWGPWAEIGLVAGAKGIKGIRPAHGLEALQRAMAGDAPQLTVLPFDLKSLLELYPAAAGLPFFTEVGGRDTHVGRLYARPALRQRYEPPRSEVERRLAELWRQALRIDRVGIHDSFFELGGDSVLATQIVVSARRTFGVTLDVGEAFKVLTIEHLARHIEAARTTAPARLVARPRAGDQVPLSFVQERQLFLELLEPGSAVNNLPLCLELEGSLDVAALEQSANDLLARHEVLRTCFTVRDGQPVAIVAPRLAITLEVDDLTAEPDALAAGRRAAREAATPFVLDRAPLLRMSLFRTAEQRWMVVVVAHHTVADGWSMGVFLHELLAGYRARLTNTPTALAPLPIQYADFAAWQRDVLAGPALDESLRYWRERLAGELPVLDLPADRRRPVRQSFTGGSCRFVLPVDVVQDLKALGRLHDATPFMVLASAYTVLLHRLTGADDVLVGVPTAGRLRQETEPLIGPFINTWVLRTTLADEPSFAALLARTREAALGAFGHQELPFERLVVDLRPPRDLGRTPIFQVLFNLQNAPLPPLDAPGLAIRMLPIERGASQFDLSLIMTEAHGTFEGAFEYNADLFDRDTVARWSATFARLLRDALRRPEEPVSRLAVLDEVESRRLLVEFNETRAEYPESSVSALVAEQAARTPDAVAVACAGRAVRYGELAARTARLADELRSSGVGPGATVGVLLDRSPELVVALLAVLEAGAAYLPLDPDTPHERIASLLSDADAVLLLTEPRLRSPVGVQTLLLTPWEDAGCATVSRMPAGPSPDHLAYVIHTSGSTGKPKGVPVMHRSVVNLLWAMRGLLGPSTDGALLAVTSISFDIAALELFLPLVSGGTVVLATREDVRDGGRLQSLLESHDVRLMQATPATWRLLLRSGWQGNGRLVAVSGGEALEVSLASQLLSRVGTLWNLYGPTETTIWSSAARVHRRDRTIPIGRPLANTRFYILDPHGVPVPTGVGGELCIGGTGVAWGYLNQPELTAERFVPDPFGPPGGRLFRTNDRARWRADGSVELLGRLDEQVKLNGFRIEPGEVEAALRLHPMVRDAAVVVRPTAGDERHLVAYVTAGEPEPSQVELRRYLRTLLPAYMVPAVFIPVSALPLTPAGKVDRRALAARAEPAALEPTGAAGTPLERHLAETYAAILGVDAVGADENFFDLGGGSLQILEIMARLRQEGITVAPESFFEHQTVAALAAHLTRATDAG